ncbi:cation:proton antiporter [Adlercreutzia aquisgranensis]|uniref:Sodium:proton antiporter n=1 Tax=Muribaculaceae bacterium Z82 TaxID=2304548 RepID=A0A7C9NN60_9BACT|nr:sodium:proton antiporter [Adlercreutzia aquisgranensis]
MELFELVLLLLGSVLVSSVFAGAISKVSLPLVQVAIGIVVAVLWQEPLVVEVDPELFLVLFIAPLLFDEARHANKRALWREKGGVVSLAVGLVLATVLVVGFVLNVLEPSIPLAAAFALGAALGPTDAVAVTSLSKDISLTQHQRTLLQGEALINDASGVVSFQFAIAAATTGAFSLIDAGVSFAVSFFGGIAVGVALAAVAMLALRMLRRSGLEDTTVYVIFEVFMPFIVFLAAEHLGTSGILAVVAAGLFMTFSRSESDAFASERKIVSSSVWDVIVFVINGVVFVLLGMELALLVSPTWEVSGMSRSTMLVLVLVVTAIVLGVRFLWLCVMECFHESRETGKRWSMTAQGAKSALVTTLSGPKGAVTLSIALTIPYYATSATNTIVAFPHRGDLIFLASGVIVLTLLLANFVVPLLAPRQEEDEASSTEAEIAILRRVASQLSSQDEGPSPATAAVVADYNERIASLMREQASAEAVRQVRLEVIERELAFLDTAAADGYASQEACERYARRLEVSHRRLSGRRGDKHALGSTRPPRTAAYWMGLLRSAVASKDASESRAAERRRLSIGVETVAVGYLQGCIDQLSADGEGPSSSTAPLAVPDDRRHALQLQLSEHRGALRMLEAARAAADAAKTGEIDLAAPLDAAGIRESIESVEAEGLRLELGQIARFEDEGRLSRGRANELREHVYLMQMALGQK